MASANTPDVRGVYLGMAWDIMSPLLLVPELTTLYALNNLDEMYGTWEQHKEKIRNVLISGTNAPLSNTFNMPNYQRQVAISSIYSTPNWKPQLRLRNKEEEENSDPIVAEHRLAGPSEILSDEDTPSEECLEPIPKEREFCSTPSVWRLKFKYQGIDRQLIYYYNFNFEKVEWPAEIQTIQHVFWIGAYQWKDLSYAYTRTLSNNGFYNEKSEYVRNNPQSKLIRTMLETRTAPQAYVYQIKYDTDELFNIKNVVRIYYGQEREGGLITRKKLNVTKPGWWEPRSNVVVQGVKGKELFNILEPARRNEIAWRKASALANTARTAYRANPNMAQAMLNASNKSTKAYKKYEASRKAAYNAKEKHLYDRLFSQEENTPINQLLAKNSDYTILGIPQNASNENIKKAYRKLALEHHPNRGGNEEHFKAITNAYNRLSKKGGRRTAKRRQSNRKTKRRS